MKKGSIVYRIEESCSYDWVYKNGDIIGIDRRTAVQIGNPWYQIVKYRSTGRKYTTGGFILDKLHTYKKRYNSKQLVKVGLKKKIRYV